MLFEVFSGLSLGLGFGVLSLGLVFGDCRNKCVRLKD